MNRSLFAPPNRLPAVLQSERSECGLACLAMIASWFGRKIDLNTLRHDYAVSARGANLADLIGIANSLGLEARPIKLEMEDMASLSLPAVLHWNMNHFVVLKAVDRNGLVIHDPAVGERRYSHKEAGFHVTGIAVEFTAGVSFEPGEHVQRSKLSELFRSEERRVGKE